MSIEKRSLVADGFYRSGQPTPDEIRAFAAEGGRTLIALNADGRLSEGEQAVTEAAGLNYIYVPLPGWLPPKTSDMQRILGCVANPALRPVWCKCYHGEDRTGTVVACYRIDHGMSADDAITEAKAHHMNWISYPMRWFIKRWKK